MKAARAGALSLVAAALATSLLAQTVWVTVARGANLREKPDRAAAVVARVEGGTRLELIDRSGEWYEVVVPASGLTAWVHRSIGRIVDDTNVGAGRAPAPPPETPDPSGSAAPPADDDQPPAKRGFASRFSAFVGGALATGQAGFQAERRFTEFAEEGRLDADYSRGVGPAFDLGLEYALRPGLGIGLHFNAASRDASSTYDASLPHPLFLARPREVAGDVDGLSYTERALHLDLAYRGGTGRLRYGVFAGPSYASVRAELVERVQYQQAYPFDAVQVTGVARSSQSGSGFGFNVGAEVDYRVGGHAAAALLFRYYKVSPDLQDSAGTVEIDAGGLQIGAGLRFFF
jgi:hypothetical protein